MDVTLHGLGATGTAKKNATFKDILNVASGGTVRQRNCCELLLKLTQMYPSSY